MKFIIYLLLLFPVTIFAQVEPGKIALPNGVQDSVLGTSLIIKDNTVIFQKVYLSKLNKTELIEKLKLFLPSVKNFQMTDLSNQNADQFSGKLTEFLINYRKYGGSLMGTAILLNSPLNGNVIVQVKDNRYRVIISDLVFKNVQVLLSAPAVDMSLDDFITKNKRTKVRNTSLVLKSAKYIDNDLSESFNLENNVKTATDF